MDHQGVTASFSAGIVLKDIPNPSKVNHNPMATIGRDLPPNGFAPLPRSVFPGRDRPDCWYKRPKPSGQAIISPMTAMMMKSTILSVEEKYNGGHRVHRKYGFQGC